MFSFAKFLPKQLGVINQCSSLILRNGAQRSIYSPGVFGIDGFNKVTNGIQKEHGNNTELVRNVLKQALDKPETKVFTEDLRIFLHLTKTDTDLDLLINAIKKYKTQEKFTTNFYFEAPLMRLLYVLNKTDKAIQLYFDKEQNIIENSASSTFILANKLAQEKRYSDLLKVFYDWLDNSKNKKQDLTSPYRLTKVVAEALLEQNDGEAINQAKDLVKKLNEFKLSVGENSLICLTLLALQQNDTSFANELISHLKEKKDLKENLKILSLVQTNQTDEALKTAQALLDAPADQTKNRINPLKKFFKSPLNNLKEALTKSNNTEGLKKLEDLTVKINQQNMLHEQDLKEFITRLISPPGAGQNRNRGPRNQNNNQLRFNNNNQQQQQQQQQNQQPRNNNYQQRKFGGNRQQQNRQNQQQSQQNQQ